MKQQLLQFFASQDQNRVLTGYLARWLAGVVTGAIVALGSSIPWLKMPDGLVTFIGGATIIIVHGQISDWVTRSQSKSIVDMQTVINASGIVEPIPVDGVLGPITQIAHREVAAVATQSTSPAQP